MRNPLTDILPEIIAPVTIYAMKRRFVQRTDSCIDSCTNKRSYCRFAVGALSGAVLLALSAPVYADNYSVQVAAPKEIKTLLETHLDIVRYRTREDIRDAYLDFLVDHVAEQAAGLLATKGYFNSRITVIDDRTGLTVGTDAQLSAADAAQATRQEAQRTNEQTQSPSESESAVLAQARPSYTIKVDLGEQVKIRSAKLTLEGLIKQQDKERAGELEFDWSLQEDEPFTQDEWSVSKTLLLRKIRSDAYAGARFKDTSAMIDVARKNADVTAVLDSGPYFTLGEVAVTGLNRYRDSVVTNVNVIEVGEAYNREKLLDYQKSLQDLPYFSNVTVDIDANPNDAQLTPIKVSVVELPSSNFKSVVGYGTDAGFHTNVQYSHYNVFKRGWIYDTRYDWQQKERIGQMSLSTPQNKKHYQWSLFGKMDQDRTTTVRDDTYQVGLHYSQKLDRSAISYNLDYYNSTLGEDSSHAWVVGLDWSKFNVDSRAYPRRGYAVDASVSVASKAVGSTASFVRWYGRYRHFFPFFKKDSLVLRGEIGFVNTNDNLYDVPSSLLFKAGGSGSLRGYPYQGIGDPTSMAAGAVLPTQFLATASAEYTHWFSDAWGWAAFYDVGSVTDKLTDRPIYHGVGMGARWRSPVGPIQFDLAYGYPRRKLSPHISIGIVF
ncbi:MAG: tama [Burkholderiaceae bacterium]|nr:tama [Burkholderiaceae bacterium]